MTETYKYKAFISYSHTDKAAGDRLLRDLEGYRVPKRLAGTPGKSGNIIENRVGRLFRDRDELPAAEDLTAEVKKALTQSEFMIVLCSPAAAASRWVNREIIEFKKLTGERRILSVILSGEPFASDRGMPEKECFPPALRFKLGKNGQLTKTPAEPLAADLRPAGDGARRGKLKLVAGLLGIGLDALVERDLQRKMRRVTAVTAASIVAMLGMGLLTNEAVNARREAEHHRSEAEGLIEFMLTDLRDKLEPVGRLDVLDAVGEQAVSYYDRQELDAMSDDALGRRARAFHLLGRVQEFTGDIEAAHQMFEKAARTTKKMLRRNPNNSDRIFEHANSLYWHGYAERLQKNLPEALAKITEYRDLTEKLVAIKRSPPWIYLRAEAELSFAALILEDQKPRIALEHFLIAKSLSEEIQDEQLAAKNAKQQLANIFGWLATTSQAIGSIDEAIEYRRHQNLLLDREITAYPKDFAIKSQKMAALTSMGRLFAQTEQLSDAIGYFEKAETLAKSLVDRDSTNAAFLEELSVNLLFKADTLISNSNLVSANRTLDEFESVANRLFALSKPNVVEKWEVRLFGQVVKLRFDIAAGNSERLSSDARQLMEYVDSDLVGGITPLRGIDLKSRLLKLAANSKS